MKYEITKGSENDFEGAPEWATECVWNDKGSESFCYWLNPKTKTIFNPNWHIKPDCWNEEYGWRNYIKAERRPITEPVWDAEGLPPVGVRCEFIRAIHWYVVEILYISGYHVVVKGEDGAEQCYQTSACQFRPIRSPEDVARSNAIGEMERAYEELTDNPAREAEEYYDLIAAGKIKGVVLESKEADLKINITTEEMWREFEKKSDMEDVRKLMMKRASRRGSF